MNSDAVNVSTLVAAPPAVAFELFTDEVDLWWGKGPRYRRITSDDAALRFEPGVGGRLVETGGGDEVAVGEITAWEPGARLVFAWRAKAFEGDEVTEVEVTFAAAGEQTRVTVIHRGWDALRADHPVRHGMEGVAFVYMMSHWWGDLLQALKGHRRA